MCLLCLYRFSELLEAVWGDILFNGRSDVLSRTGFTLADVASTVKQNLGKVAKHSKHTTDNGLQTLFRFLGILHGKLTIYILDRISAPYKQLTLRFG